VDEDKMKEALKEALKEWMDDKLLQFGKFSIASIGIMGVVALVYFILKLYGWSR